MAKITGTQKFLLADLPRTLFPMRTDEVLVKHSAAGLHEYAYEKILNSNQESHCFLSQQTVFADNARRHLRRTVKLDPVAEWFLYDMVYRNKSRFRRSRTPGRVHFGYRFKDGKPIDGRVAYREFSKQRRKLATQYSGRVSFDVASYFNNIYHHDLASWFRDRVASNQEDAENFGRFMREINSSRSVGFLPQGIYPAKMLGNAFLSFVDEAGRVKSASYLRFMDDFVLFDDSEVVLLRDFNFVQTLLGNKGLSLNPLKTKLPDEPDDPSMEDDIDDIREELLDLRRVELADYGGESGDDDDEEDGSTVELNEEQVEYLMHLLRGSRTLEESDAELVLTLMSEHSEDVLERLREMTVEFPNLTKAIHRFSRHVHDRSELARLVSDVLTDESVVMTEFQLFWLATLVEDRLLDTRLAGNLIQALLDHPNSTPIAKARVLEIPERRFGMPDRREEALKSGQSDWCAWASAVGSRNEEKGRRNYVRGCPIGC